MKDVANKSRLVFLNRLSCEGWKRLEKKIEVFFVSKQHTSLTRLKHFSTVDMIMVEFEKFEVCYSASMVRYTFHFHHIFFQR